METVTGPKVKDFLPKKQPWSHKGEFGKLLIIGGSSTLYGAPVLSALAALRTGCDLTKIVAPERSAIAYASMSPALIVEPVSCKFFTSWHARGLLELAKPYDAVLIGPGLGRRPETLSFVRSFLSGLDIPCVIDADALHAIPYKNVPKPSHILTPHSREFQAISGQAPSTDIKERSSQAFSLAKELGCTLLLKGHEDIIADCKTIWLNKTGTPNMTKGGTGDVLSGCCGALLAMGLTPFKASAAAAYITGLAGELSSKEFGQGLLPTDVIDQIPKTLMKILK